MFGDEAIGFMSGTYRTGHCAGPKGGRGDGENVSEVPQLVICSGCHSILTPPSSGCGRNQEIGGTRYLIPDAPIQVTRYRHPEPFFSYRRFNHPIRYQSPHFLTHLLPLDLYPIPIPPLRPGFCYSTTSPSSSLLRHLSPPPPPPPFLSFCCSPSSMGS